MAERLRLVIALISLAAETKWSPQNIVSSPVQLVVSKATRLWVNATDDKSSSTRVVYGWLRNATSGVGNKTIKITVNGTVYSVVTNGSGYFGKSFNLQPKDNKPTVYMITAQFEGDNPRNATAYARTPDATRYAVCTTTYFGYKPSANSTSLLVEPVVAVASVQTKTPEQMQQEAEQGGELRPKNEFSLWCPWYRLHLISSLDGEDISDVGLAPLGFDTICIHWQLDQWIREALDAYTSVYKGVLIGYASTEIAVWAAMQGGPGAFAVAFVGSVVVKTLLLMSVWNSIAGLKSALVGAVVSYVLGLVGVARTLVSGAIDWTLSFIELAKSVNFWKFLYKWIYVPINTVFLTLILGRLHQLGGI